MRHVIVKAHDENWSRKFNKEAELIREIFKDELVEIHHIGSTSVPGLKAKPIIDIMPVVRDIERVDQFNDEMIQAGYEPLGEYGIKGRRYFRKGGDDRTHHVHVFQQDNSEDIDRHLAVRDYLRTYGDAAHEYGELKAQLADAHPHDMQAYIDGKNDFVKNLERQALAWKRRDI